MDKDIELSRKKNNERYAKNREKRLAHIKEYEVQNAEKIKEYRCGYRKRDSTKKLYQGYNKKRSETKYHKISQKDWIKCLEFFGYKCAYCGMTEKEHKEKYNQQLHKDHAINNGSNTIENCLPSCRSCNSTKHNADWMDWYTQNNSIFSQDRYIKIQEWFNLHNVETEFYLDFKKG